MAAVSIVVRDALGPPHRLSRLTFAGHWICIDCGYIAEWAFWRPLTCPNESAVLREVPWTG